MSDPSSASSPAVSTEPGTETNPNTPRSDKSATKDLPSDNQNIVSNAQASIYASPPPSNLSRQQDHSIIQPTQPNKVKQKKIPASAFWNPDQDINDIFLDIFWAELNSCALFRLHTTIRLESMPDAPESLPNSLIRAFIFIYPEHIRRLSFTERPEKTPFGPPTIALTFELDEPPALILPKTYTSFGQGAKGRLRSLQSLARQSSFTIYASLPGRVLSTKWWGRICNDIAEQKIKTIASLANLTTLYEGRGGYVIDGDNLLEDQDDALQLPPYQETNPSDPLARPTKRKRSCDESSMIGRTAHSTDIIAMQARIGNIETKLAAYGRQMKEIEQTVKETVKATVKEVSKEIFQEMFQQMISPYIRKIDDKLESVEDDMHSELREAIEARIALQMDGVQECILEQLSSVPIQAYFTFPTHPYY